MFKVYLSFISIGGDTLIHKQQLNMLFILSVTVLFHALDPLAESLQTLTISSETFKKSSREFPPTFEYL